MLRVQQLSSANTRFLFNFLLTKQRSGQCNNILVKNFIHYLYVCKHLVIWNSKLMALWGCCCVCVFPLLHRMSSGKTGGLFARSSLSVNIMRWVLFPLQYPSTYMFNGLFSICSFISTSWWRCLSLLKYPIITVHIRLDVWGFLLLSWGDLLQVSIWLEKNCVSICFQSQHLCLKNWKCSKKSFCLVILLSFMNGFLEHFLILLRGKWLGWGYPKNIYCVFHKTLMILCNEDRNPRKWLRHTWFFFPQVQQQVSLLSFCCSYVNGRLHTWSRRPSRWKHPIWLFEWWMCACGFQLPFQ